MNVCSKCPQLIANEENVGPVAVELSRTQISSQACRAEDLGSQSFMGIYQIDPTKDLRWAEFVGRHPKASVFHSVGWLEALRWTYGYEPVVFSTSPPTGELKNGLVFCRVKSWLTGRRLVSLPFSDHCEPLCESKEEISFLMRYLQAALKHENWRYLEVRPINGDFGQGEDRIKFLPAMRYFLHRLDLQPDLEALSRSFDKDCVQRRIHRAEKAGLIEKCGRSEKLLKDFYKLFVATRSRHHLPPMSYAWFRNLQQCMSESLEIRLAYKGEIPISAILTLQFKDTVLYKYGCSDTRFNRFGATPWLLWRAIAAAKSNGATRFDLGRTEEDNKGLLEFKNHWVPQPIQLTYWRFPESPTLDSAKGWPLKAAKLAFGFVPKAFLRLTGRLLYRHVG